MVDRNVKTLLVLVLFLLTSPASSQSGQAGAGATIYAEYCSVCHGDRGNGDSHVRQGLRPQPRDFTTAEASRVLTRDRMIAAVRDGVPGTAMAGWGSQLSDVDIATVVDYIRGEFMVMATKDGVDGRTIYAETCSVCHGDDGQGAVWGRESLNPPPVDFTDPLVRQRLTRQRMIASVTHGRQGTAMSAFATQLDAVSIAAVVDYIRAAFMQSSVSPTPHTASPGSPPRQVAQPDWQVNAGDPLPLSVKGDFEAGRAYYLQNCTACHGADGNGAGPRAYFIFPKPRDFRHPGMRGTFDRARLFRAIKLGVRGREMPAWGKVLDDQQVADITEYVYRAFINPEP